MAFANVFQGKRVLVTGHTGFKGSWLSEWLLALGADVVGFALAPQDQSLFKQLKLQSRLDHREGDIRDLSSIIAVITETNPSFVFHLAAQPLVRLSFREPLDTFAINVIGTANVLEALRVTDTRCSIVAITTDKCYENREWVHSYREEDPMGGYDPYSASKGATELLISSYRRSFFSHTASRVKLASARAGNVIGGGDYAADRILPDCVRSLTKGDPIQVRNRFASRPWQHVLEPLSGYLWNAAAMSADAPIHFRFSAEHYATSFNFGPTLTSNRTVSDLVEEVLRHWPGSWKDRGNSDAAHEATLLNLSTDKAFHLLKWQPVWNFSDTICNTVDWYRAAHDRSDFNPAIFTRQQIEKYSSDAFRQGVAWALT